MRFSSVFALALAMVTAAESPLFTAAAKAEITGNIAIPVPKPDTVARTTEKVEMERIYQSACPAVISGRVKAMPLLPIADGKCGERSPIKVSAVGNVRLSAPATMNCRMATALARWLRGVDEQAINMFGSPVIKLHTSTSYQCRRRNNAPDGKISEHGFANALDIVGFELNSGVKISILNDWPLSRPSSDEPDGGEITAAPEPDKEAAFLRLVHIAACKQFTTVLGPEADRHHTDHFHFDLGCHGNRCTYKICE